MRPSFRLVLLILVCGLARSGHGAPARSAAVLTAEELFRPRSVGAARLSPHGRYFGALVQDQADNGGLLVVDLATFKPSPLRGDRSFDIHSFRWLGDDRLLFQVSKDKLYAWGLFATSVNHLGESYPINSFDVAEVIGVPQARPGRVLVWIKQSAEDTFHRPETIVELDAMHPQESIGRTLGGNDVLRSYEPPPAEAVLGWQCNHDGDLALCWTWSEGREHLHHFVRATNSWREVDLHDHVVSTMELDPDERFLWCVTYEPVQGYGLSRMDLDSGEISAPVLTDPSYNPAEGVLHFTASGALAGVTYERQQTTSVWLSKQYASIQAAADHLHPDTINTLVQNDAAGRKFLFRLTGPADPGTYAVLDLDAKAMHLIAESAPWLKGRPLVPTKPVAFTARDGTRIEGYLTIPPGVTARHPAPLVVLPHGGPWVRDSLAFDPEVQFLASRGYIVLQPNYRGSTGYAPAISLEHKFDFRIMHDDVTDATKWMLAGGLVDPKRVAIMGASFGGFLAVAGAAFEPDLYCCAVTTCGVFDWERHIKSKWDYSRPGEYEVLRDKLGHRGRNHEALEALSPLAHVERIHIPIFIAHGTEDSIADVAQSKQLAAALKERGVPCETFFRSLEGHGFYNYKHRVDYYHHVEAFLAAHLGNPAPAH